jgi:hypothetical protein
MLLTAPNGSQVEAHLVGYESPMQDRNWLLVAIWVCTAEGSGACMANCWQAEEVRRMVVWFTAMADGVPVDEWGGACLEANLEFELVAASAESVTVRAHFILERGAWYPADGTPPFLTMEPPSTWSCYRATCDGSPKSLPTSCGGIRRSRLNARSRLPCGDAAEGGLAGTPTLSRFRRVPTRYI